MFMIKAWKVRMGDEITANQVIAEIVDVVDVDAPRVPIVSRATGTLFGTCAHKLVKPGDLVAYVAGSEPLSWRVGSYLLSL